MSILVPLGQHLTVQARLNAVGAGAWGASERSIYANPCKQVSQIKYAACNGVLIMTFDSDIENESLQSTSKGKVWFLLIVTEDFKVVCRLRVKLGATLKTSKLLLKRAKELNIDVTGVSVHVGSEWMY